MSECYACGVNTELVEEMSRVVESAEAVIDAAAGDDMTEVVSCASDLRIIVHAYRATRTRIEKEGEDALQ